MIATPSRAEVGWGLREVGGKVWKEKKEWERFVSWNANEAKNRKGRNLRKEEGMH